MNQQGPLTFVRLYVAAGIGIKCNFESDQSRQKRISHPSRRLNCEDINFHGRADIFSSCKDSYIRWGGFPPTSIATIFPTFGSLSWSWPISYIFCEGSIMNYAGYIYGKNIDARTWWILRNWIWTRVFGRSPGQRLTVTMILFCFFTITFQANHILLESLFSFDCFAFAWFTNPCLLVWGLGVGNHLKWKGKFSALWNVKSLPNVGERGQSGSKFPPRNRFSGDFTSGDQTLAAPQRLRSRATYPDFPI